MYAGVPSTCPWSVPSPPPGPGAIAGASAADEAHRVERLPVGPAPQLVDRDDARVLQLPGDPGLADEAGGEHGLAGVIGPQVLEGDVTAQGGVVGQPDPADAARGVQGRQ